MGQPAETRNISPGMKLDKIRSTATTLRQAARILSNTYEAIDMVAVGSAAYGNPMWVAPYDILMLLLTHTSGTATTSVDIRAQVSHGNNDDPGAEWYQLQEAMPQLAVDGALSQAAIEWAITVAQAAGTVKYAIPIRLNGARWIKFKIGVVGATKTNSRAVLLGIPDKLGV